MLGLTYFFIILAPGLLFNLIVWSLWWRILLPRAKVIAATVLLISVYWGIIDMIAIRLLGIWSFRPDHTTGLMAFGLNVEEWTLFLASGSFIVPLIFVFVERDRIWKRKS